MAQKQPHPQLSGRQRTQSLHIVVTGFGVVVLLAVAGLFAVVFAFRTSEQPPAPRIEVEATTTESLTASEQGASATAESPISEGDVK